ncbi:hypothetical protein B0H13DRAFT_2346048 [Mycena leptocephala]|nr:hypothetical protein B0H13DRAFT_2346048 [Mycena leptocephala]
MYQRQQAAKQEAHKRSDMYTRLEDGALRARQLSAEQSADIVSGVRERADMCTCLESWNDDASDELFYVGRPRWRTVRVQYLAVEQAADAANAAWEEEEVGCHQRDTWAR